MNTAEWILVAFLSVALLTFLILAIVLVVKLIEFTVEAKKIALKGQDIAEKTDDIVNNVKNYTTVGGIVGAFTSLYNTTRAFKKQRKETDVQEEQEIE